MYRVISIILILAFLAYDISWAYPDSNQNSTALQIQTLINRKDDTGKLKFFLADILTRYAAQKIPINELSFDVAPENADKRCSAQFSKKEGPIKETEQFVSYLVPCLIEDKTYYAYVTQSPASFNFNISIYTEEEKGESFIAGHKPDSKRAAAKVPADEGLKVFKAGRFTQLVYHLRVGGIVRYYNKVWLFKPKDSKYRTKPGEGKPARMFSYPEASSKIKEAIRELEKISIENAKMLKSRITILGVRQTTNLIFFDRKNKFYLGMHAGRRRNTIYIPLKLISRLTAEELAVYLNDRVAWLDIYNRLMERGAQEEEMNLRLNFHLAVGDKDSLERLNKRLEDLSIEDALTIGSPKYREKMERDRKEADYQWRVLQRRWTGVRLDYFDLANKFGVTSNRYANAGDSKRAKEYMRKRIEVLRFIQYKDKGMLPVDLRERIIYVLLREGMFKEFIKELELFLKGGPFKYKSLIRELTKDEQGFRLNSFLGKDSFGGFKTEVLYLLSLYKSITSGRDLEAIVKIEEQAAKLFHNFEARHKARLKPLSPKRTQGSFFIYRLDGAKIKDAAGEEFVIRVSTVKEKGYNVLLEIARASDNRIIGNFGFNVERVDPTLGLITVELKLAEVSEDVDGIDYRNMGIAAAFLKRLYEFAPPYIFIMTSIQESETLKDLIAAKQWDETKTARLFKDAGWILSSLTYDDENDDSYSTPESIYENIRRDNYIETYGHLECGKLVAIFKREDMPGPGSYEVVKNLKTKALSQKSIAITKPAKQSNLPFYEFGAWTAIYSTFVNRAGWQGLDSIDRFWPAAIGIGIAAAIFWLANKIDWHRLRRQIRRSFKESFTFWGSYKIGISIFLFIACFGSYISINWPKLANYAIEQEIESRGQELAAQVEYAKSLLNEGKSPEEVARIFGATPEEIRAMQSLPPDEIGRLKNLDSGTIAEIVRRKFPQFSAQIPVSLIIDRLGYEGLKEKGRFTGVVTVTSSGNRRLFDVRGWLERVGKSGSWLGKVTHYVSGMGGRDKYGNVGAARLTDNGRNIDIGAGVTSSGIPKAIVFNPEVTASGVNGLKLKEVDPITNKVTVEDTGRRPIRPSDIVYYSTFLLYSGIALGLLLIYIELLFGFGFDLSNFTYSLAATYILHIFIYSDIKKKTSGNETEIKINPGIGERINGLLLNSFKKFLESRDIKIFELESPLRAKIGETDEEEPIIAYMRRDETKKKTSAFYYYEKALLSLNPISLLYVLLHEGLEINPRLGHRIIYPTMFASMIGVFMLILIPLGLNMLTSVVFAMAGLKFTPREESSKHVGMKFTKWVLLNLIPHSKIEEISQSMNDSVGRKVFIKYFLHQETYEAIAKELHSFPSDVHNILKKYISRPSIEQLILKWRGMINEVLEDLGKEARLFPYEILVFRLHFGLREDGEEYTYEEIIKEAKKISSKNKEIDASKLSHISNVSKIINEIVIPKVLDKLSTELVEITAPPGELNHKGYKTRSESPSKFDKNLYELYGLKVRDEKELDKKLLMMLKGYKKTISAFEKLVRSAINNVERRTPNKDFNIIQKLSKLAPANMKILFERIPKDLTEDFYDKVAGASVVMHLLSNSRYNKRGFTDLRIGLLISISLALIPLTIASSYTNNSSAWAGVIIGSVLLAIVPALALLIPLAQLAIKLYEKYKMKEKIKEEAKGQPKISEEVRKKILVLDKKYIDALMVLELPPDASMRDLKKEWLRLSMKYHPDRNPGDKAAEESFKKIINARDKLEDPRAKEILEARDGAEIKIRIMDVLPSELKAKVADYIRSFSEDAERGTKDLMAFYERFFGNPEWWRVVIQGFTREEANQATELFTEAWSLAWFELNKEKAGLKVGINEIFDRTADIISAKSSKPKPKSLPPPSRDGYIMQGEEALKKMVENIANGKSEVATDTDYSQVKADIKAITERLKQSGREPIDVPLRIIGTDEMIVSDKDFAFGFYSHAPPIMKKLIELLGSETEFNRVFPIPTLVLTHKILKNSSPLIRQEYIYHELICHKTGHYEAIFEQQDIFTENYEDGEYDIEGARKKYLPGHLNDLDRHNKPFKGALGKVIKDAIYDALTKLYLESPKEFKLKFKGRDVVLKLERLDRKNFELLDKWQEIIYPLTYDEAELKKRLDDEWERKQEDLKNNKLNSVVITSEFRGEPQAEAVIEYKFLPYYHNQVWIFRLETAPWNRIDTNVDTSATRLDGIETILVEYASKESFKGGGEGIVLVDAYNSEEFYKETGFQYIAETPQNIQERYSATGFIDKPKVMLLLPKPLPEPPDTITFLLKKADSSQGEEKRKWLENVITVINDELKIQDEGIESERERLSTKGEKSSSILENLLAERLALKLKLDYAIAELVPIFIRDAFELKDRISQPLRTEEEQKLLDIFIEYILKREPVLKRTRHILAHCIDAMDMVTLLGEKMGIPADEINDLRFAAFVHDIGKLYSEEFVDFFDDPRHLEEFSGEERKKAERFIKEHRARSIEILEKAGIKLKPTVKEMTAGHNLPRFPLLFISDMITAWHDIDRPYKKSPPTGKEKYKTSMEVLDEIETVHALYLNWYPKLAEAFAAARELAEDRRYEKIVYRTYPDKRDGSISSDSGRVSSSRTAPEEIIKKDERGRAWLNIRLFESIINGVYPKIIVLGSCRQLQDEDGFVPLYLINDIDIALLDIPTSQKDFKEQLIDKLLTVLNSKLKEYGNIERDRELSHIITMRLTHLIPSINISLDIWSLKSNILIYSAGSFQDQHLKYLINADSKKDLHWLKRYLSVEYYYGDPERYARNLKKLFACTSEENIDSLCSEIALGDFELLEKDIKSLPKEDKYRRIKERLRPISLTESDMLLEAYNDDYRVSVNKAIIRLREIFVKDNEIIEILRDEDFIDILLIPRIIRVMKVSVDKKDMLEYVVNSFNLMIGMDFRVLEVNNRLYVYSEGYLRKYLEAKGENVLLSSITAVMEKLKLELQDKNSPIYKMSQWSTKKHTKVRVDVQLPSDTRIPLKVKDIVIPTANRSESLNKTLVSIIRNIRLYGWTKLQITIFDTSTDKNEIAKNRDVINSFSSKNSDIQFIHKDMAEIEYLLHGIYDRLDGEAKEAFAELYINRQDRLTIGAIRNIIALYYGTKPYISMDDDIRPEGAILSPSKFKKTARSVRSKRHGIDLFIGVFQDYLDTNILSTEDFLNETYSLDVDFIGMVNRYLDMTEGARPYYIVGRWETFSQEKGKVSFVRTYCTGEHGDVIYYLDETIKSNDISFLSTKDLNKSAIINAPAVLLRKGICNGGFFATSSTFEAPFLDLAIYEDGAQLYLRWLYRPQDLQFQGGAFFHDRYPAGRGDIYTRIVNAVIARIFLEKYIYPVVPGSIATKLYSKPWKRAKDKNILHELALELKKEVYRPSKNDMDYYRRYIKTIRTCLAKANKKKYPWVRQEIKRFKNQSEFTEELTQEVQKSLIRSALILEHWTQFQKGAAQLISSTNKEWDVSKDDISQAVQDMSEVSQSETSLAPLESLLAKATKDIGSINISDGIEKFIKKRNLKKYRYLSSMDITKEDLPSDYSTTSGLREPKKVGRLPKSLDEIPRVKVILPDVDVFLVSRAHSGGETVVRLGFLEDGRPVAVKENIRYFPSDFSLEILDDYKGAKIADDLGIGPKIHGIFQEADNLGIVMDIVPGDFELAAKDFIALATIKDLIEINRRLGRIGRSMQWDFQYFVTPEGRIQVIDQISILLKKLNPKTFIRQLLNLLDYSSDNVKKESILYIVRNEPRLFVSLYKFLQEKADREDYAEVLMKIIDDIKNEKEEGIPTAEAITITILAEYPIAIEKHIKLLIWLVKKKRLTSQEEILKLYKKILRKRGLFIDFGGVYYKDRQKDLSEQRVKKAEHLIAGLGLTSGASRAKLDSVLFNIIKNSTEEDYRLLRILGFKRKQAPLVIGKKFKDIHELISIDGVGPGTLKNALDGIRLSIKCQEKYKEGFVNFVRLALSIDEKDSEGEVQKKIEESYSSYRSLLRNREFLEDISTYFKHDPRILFSLVYILYIEIRAGPKGEASPAIDTLLKLTKLWIGIKPSFIPTYKLMAIRFLGLLDVKKAIPRIIIPLAHYKEKDEFYQTAFDALVNLAKEGDLRNFYAFIQPAVNASMAKLAIEAVSEAKPGRESGMKFLKEALKHPNPDVRSLAEDKLHGMAPEEPFKNIPGSLVSVIDMLESRSGGHPLINAIYELFGWKIDFTNEAINEVDYLTDAEILEQAAEALKQFSEREENKDIPSRTDNLAEFIKIEIIGEYDIFQLLHGLYAGSLYYHYKTLEIEKKPSLATKNEDALKEEFKGLYTFLKAISITMREIEIKNRDSEQLATPAIALILPQRLAGYGDIVFMVNTAQKLKEMYPDIPIKALFGRDEDYRSLGKIKLVGDFDSDKIIQELDGVIYINAEASQKQVDEHIRIRKVNEFIGRNDLAIIYAVYPDEYDGLESIYFGQFGRDAASRIMIHELGREMVFEDPNKNGDYPLGFNKDSLGLPPAAPNFTRYIKHVRNKDKKGIYEERRNLLRKIPGYDVLEEDRIIKGRWGFIYAHTQQDVRKYFKALDRAKQTSDIFDAEPNVIFAIHGEADKGFRDEVLRIASQEGYGVFEYNQNSKMLEPANISKSNITVILDTEVPRKLFGQLFVLSDDLPSLITDQDNLSNMIHLNQNTQGRTFFWEASVFQAISEIDLRGFAKEVLTPDEYTIFEATTKTGQDIDYDLLARLFTYHDDYRGIYRKLAIEIGKKFNFEKRIDRIMQEWHENIKAKEQRIARTDLEASQDQKSGTPKNRDEAGGVALKGVPPTLSIEAEMASVRASVKTIMYPACDNRDAKTLLEVLHIFPDIKKIILVDPGFKGLYSVSSSLLFYNMIEAIGFKIKKEPIMMGDFGKGGKITVETEKDGRQIGFVFYAEDYYKMAKEFRGSLDLIIVKYPGPSGEFSRDDGFYSRVKEDLKDRGLILVKHAFLPQKDDPDFKIIFRSNIHNKLLNQKLHYVDYDDWAVVRKTSEDGGIRDASEKTTDLPPNIGSIFKIKTEGKLNDILDRIEYEPEPSRDITSFEKLFNDFKAKILTLRNLISERLVSIAGIDKTDQDAIIIYADNMLEQGAVVDFESMLAKTSILDNSTIMIYGRKPGAASLVERIIRDANKLVRVIVMESRDLKEIYKADDIDIEHPNEERELDSIIRYVHRKGFNNGRLLGVIKGATDYAYKEKIKEISSRHKSPVISFESDQGLYLFSDALRELIKIKKEDGPKNNEWFKFLKPLEKLSKEIEKTYGEYRMMLNVLMTKA